MDVRYYLNPVTGQPHVYDHGVSEFEVEWILAHPREDRLLKDGARQVIGQSEGGRCLRVIYVPDDVGDGIFVITAYPLSGKPLQAFRRRQRRRRR